MRKVDISYRHGTVATEEQVEELEKLVGLNTSEEIMRLIKKFKQYDWGVDIVIYPEKDIGLPPRMIEIKGEKKADGPT